MSDWGYDLIFYCIMILVVIPVGLLASQFKHQPSEMRWLMFTLILSFMCDFLSDLSARFRILFVNLGGITYGIVAPLFFAFFFNHVIRWRKLKKIIFSVGCGLTSFAIYNAIFLQGKKPNSYSATLLSLFILALSIIYFYKLIKELPTSRIHDLPLFWVISSFFFTHAGKLVLNIVSHYMMTIMKDNLMVLWTVHNMLTMVGLVALTKGVWLHVRASNDNVISTGN